MSTLNRRLSKAMFVAVLLVLAPAWLVGLPSGGEVRAADSSVRFGPIPVRGDCRTVVASPGQECTWDAWTGEVTISPKIIREGETLNVSVSICCGAISYVLRQIAECTDTKKPQDVEVKGPDGKWVLEKKDVVVASACTWKPGPTGGRWGTVGADITGPCGSQIAVQEGRAEFAACGSATDSDYFGVIPKEEELWAISGRLSAKDNRRIRGVLVELSGDERQAAVTSSSGDYAFLVKKGSYTVTTEEGFCASVDGSPVSGCSRSGSVNVPGSHSVDFRPEKEGVIKGTVLDAKGKGVNGATVSAVGKTGQTVVTDPTGAYTMTLVAGSYQATAFGAWKAGPPDAAGKPTLVRTVYCTSPIGECGHWVSATVKGDDEQTINWQDRGVLGTPADEQPPPSDPTKDQSDATSLDLWFLASVLVAGGAGIAGAGAGAAGGDGEGGGAGGGGGGGPDKPWSEMTDEEKEQFRSWFLERWKEAHPNHSAEQLSNLIELLHQQPDGFWEKNVQFAIDMGMSVKKDLSGEGLQGTLDGSTDQLLYLAKRDVADPLSALAAIGGAPDEVLMSDDSKALKQWLASGKGQELLDELTADPVAFSQKYDLPEWVRDFGDKEHGPITSEDTARYRALYDEYRQALASGDDYNANRLRATLGVTTVWIAGQFVDPALAADGLAGKTGTKTVVGGLEQVATTELSTLERQTFTHLPSDMVLDAEQRAFLSRELGPLETIVDSNGNPINTLNQTQRLTFNDGGRAILKPESGAGESVGGSGTTKYSSEVGSYVVDRALGFDQVPTTAVIDHPDLGRSAIQSWESGTGVTSAGAFSTTDQQMAAVRDYITGESDRHLGNVLQSPDGKLIAIDGGEAFPPGGGENPIYRSEFVFNTLDQDLEPSVLAAVQNVDRAALSQGLLDIGLNQQQVDAALGRLDSIKTEGKLTLSGLGSSGQTVTVVADDFTRGVQQVQLP